MKKSPHTGRAVIVLGDHDTGQRTEMLSDKAAEHGATITEVHTFNPGEVAPHDDLTQVETVVTALGRAIATRADIWAPFWREDLAREEHTRRLSLVLQRRCLNLLLGPNLWPCPRTGGINEIDYALRQEVRNVDALDHAAIAAAALPTLSVEIEQTLHASQRRPAPASSDTMDKQPCDVLELIKADFGPHPALPATTAPWPQRRADLKRFASWLIDECGLTQSEAATLLNTSGHRTAHGRLWQRSSVSALVNGRYDRRTAA